MQQTIDFMQISGCRAARTPYNAHPTTRHNGLHSTVCRMRKLSSVWEVQEAEPPEEILKKGIDSEGGKRNIRHLATDG